MYKSVSLLDFDQSVNALTAHCVALSVFGGIKLSFSAWDSQMQIVLVSVNCFPPFPRIVLD